MLAHLAGEALHDHDDVFVARFVTWSRLIRLLLPARLLVHASTLSPLAVFGGDVAASDPSLFGTRTGVEAACSMVVHSQASLAALRSRVGVFLWQQHARGRKATMRRGVETDGRIRHCSS